MNNNGPNRTLGAPLTVLARLGVVPRAGCSLQLRAAKALDELERTILREIPNYSASANPQVLPELKLHAKAHVEEISRLLGGGLPAPLEFVKAHAVRRADQHFPLESLLHAYRCGHKVLSRWMRDAAIDAAPGNVERAVAAIADFAIEYTDLISTLCAAEYVARTRKIAEAEGDRRTELLNLLVAGYDESDARAARLMKRAGYLEQRQSYCVVLAQSTDPLEMENPGRAQRIIAAVTEAVQDSSVRTLTGLRDNAVICIYSDTRRVSGWTAPQSALAERISAALLSLGPAVLIGVSADAPSSAHIPRAVHEAGVALDFASVTNRVVSYAELPIRRLLLHRGSDYVQSALPAWSGEMAAADDKTGGELIRTLRALADANLNVQQAGRRLALHANTVYARLRRIEEITGLRCQSFHDLNELLLAADCRPSPAP
ncbi:MAG: helix-turn-helix domain-containing protein [Steroidobacteraceae bacterium]